MAFIPIIIGRRPRYGRTNEKALAKLFVVFVLTVILSMVMLIVLMSLGSE